jgi:hypothetical protein
MASDQLPLLDTDSAACADALREEWDALVAVRDAEREWSAARRNRQWSPERAAHAQRDIAAGRRLMDLAELASFDHVPGGFHTDPDFTNQQEV